MIVADKQRPYKHFNVTPFDRMAFALIYASGDGILRLSPYELAERARAHGHWQYLSDRIAADGGDAEREMEDHLLSTSLCRDEFVRICVEGRN